MTDQILAPRRATVLMLTVTLALGSLLGALAPTSAEAATPPVLQREATNGVTADVLPTTQINPTGWVEDQAIKGDTVFAGGTFTSARPAGSPSGTDESARSNLLAYSLSTGVLNAGFHPVLDKGVRVLALSPDGSRLYAGGDFTRVDGTTRNRLVAFSTSTGKVDTSFAVDLNGPVYAIAATSTRVYVGGQFTQANGNDRGRLAAFTTSGGLLSGWTPATDQKSVRALLVAPGGRVVAGGSFQSVTTGSTTVAADGSASLDPSSGTPGTWQVNSVVKQGGSGAAVLSLHTDGTNVFGSGYRFGTSTANYEGVWAARPSDGSIVWLDDCHGDTYDTTILSGVVYVATHQHDCANIGGFPEQTPTRIERRATAFTSSAQGTVQANSLLPGTFSSFPGYPAPALVNWFPDFKNPTCPTSTSCLYDSQPTNTIESSGSYVAVGGQFPTVNGVAQQGLARFAKPSVSPSKEGPRTYNGTGPTVRAVASNVMRVTAAPGDRDDLVLSRVELWRTDKSSPVWSADNLTAPWWRTTVAYTDTSVSAGRTYVYYLKMTDPDGNTTTSGQGYAKTPASGTVGSTTYSQQVLADGAAHYWRLDDAAGSTVATDWAGQTDLTLQPGVTTGATGVDGSDTAATASGATNAAAAPREAYRAPQTFSAEAWFKTTSTGGGEVIGYGNKAVGKSEIRDRQVYLNPAGQLVYWVSSGGSKSITSPGSYNDGKYHQVVATLSPETGMVLYVDGAQVASWATVTSAQDYTGFWRVAGDAVPGSGAVWLNGAVDEVSVYPTALGSATVADHYNDATGKVPALTPTAAFTTSCTDLACAYDATRSTASAATSSTTTSSGTTIKAYAWSLGDGSRSSGSTARHTYKKSSRYDVALTVTNSNGARATAVRTVRATGNVAPVARMTSTVAKKKVTLDAARSTDSDGRVRTYRWNFGDGASSTRRKASHTYVGYGLYPVRLTVTDDKGRTGSSTRVVQVGRALAADTFQRNAAGWGSATKGGRWTTSPRAAFTVRGGRGQLGLGAPGRTATARLAKVSRKSANVVGDVAVSKVATGSGTTSAYLLRQRSSSAYRAKLVLLRRGSVDLLVTRVVSGKEKTVKRVRVRGLTYRAGETLRVRATISSATRARIKVTVWRSGTKEPRAQLSTTDSTKALRRSGAVGVSGTVARSATNAPVVLAYDDLLVTAS